RQDTIDREPTRAVDRHDLAEHAHLCARRYVGSLNRNGAAVNRDVPNGGVVTAEDGSPLDAASQKDLAEIDRAALRLVIAAIDVVDTRDIDEFAVHAIGDDQFGQAVLKRHDRER